MQKKEAKAGPELLQKETFLPPRLRHSWIVSSFSETSTSFFSLAISAQPPSASQVVQVTGMSTPLGHRECMEGGHSSPPLPGSARFLVISKQVCAKRAHCTKSGATAFPVTHCSQWTFHKCRPFGLLLMNTMT